MVSTVGCAQCIATDAPIQPIAMDFLSAMGMGFAIQISPGQHANAMVTSRTKIALHVKQDTLVPIARHVQAASHMESATTESPKMENVIAISATTDQPAFSLGYM